jgi:hypothetical protein
MGRVKREMDARGVIKPFLSNFFFGGGQRDEEARRGDGVTVSCGRCRQVKKEYRQEHVPAYKGSAILTRNTKCWICYRNICLSKEYCKVRCRFYLGNVNFFKNFIQRKDT